MTGSGRQEVVRRLAEVAGPDVDPATIADDHRLRDDLGIGSLDAILLILELEDAFGVEVSDDELAALDTVASLLALVDRKQSAGPDSPDGEP